MPKPKVSTEEIRQIAERQRAIKKKEAFALLIAAPKLPEADTGGGK